MAKSRRTGLVRQNTDSSSGGYTYYNKTFDDVTDLFLFACSHGDYMLVHRLLEEGEAEADVTNKMGKSALQISIENEHFEVVRVLLDTIPYEKFRDALLLAIYLGHTIIADFIMNHPTYRTFSGGFLDPTSPQAYDDSQFSSDISPLILAAQYNRLQIVHQLLIAGERIKTPHAHMCQCPDCLREMALDSFRQAQVRLSAYKGLASEVYIALAYPDPFLQAFQLRHELLTLAKVEHYFYADYKKLAKQLSIFVARLLDNVRGHEELEMVLNKTGLPHEEKYEKLARFDLAIHYREKPFVSHSNCQQKLMEIWYEDLPIIKNAHLPKRLLFYICYLICFPFLAIIYYILPQSKIGLLCQQPNLRFKAYIGSYFTFIGLIFASSYFSSFHLSTSQMLSEYDQSLYRKYIQYIYLNTNLNNALTRIASNVNSNGTDSAINCDIGLRFMVPNLFQIMIFIWLVGFVWNEIKQIFGLGIRVYLIIPSNFVDCSMNILYIFYFVFLYAAMIYTRTSMTAFKSEKYWNQLAKYDSLSDRDQQYLLGKTSHLLYWLNADRFYWVNGDLQTLAEAFFAMGNVVSICRICFLLPIIAFVGPLQVMLERMMIDISKWILIIAIFFTGFACALFFIYASFAIILDEHTALTGGSSSAQSSSATPSTNSTIPSQCSDYFYQLLNQSRPDTVDTSANDNSYTGNDTCQLSSSYGTLVEIGPYPAVHYFGQSFGSTLSTLFFTLFGVIGQNGMADRGYELLTRSCYKPDPNSYLSNFDQFTTNLGFIFYGLFSFIFITVLINTLIAMLERTIEEIDERADIEWKFARSKLYMEYIRDGDPLPVPLNICPSPQAILKFLHQIKEMIFSKKSLGEKHHPPLGEQRVPEHAIRLDIGRGQNRTTKAAAHGANGDHKKHLPHHHVDRLNEKLTYQVVIERIVKRFLLYYQSTHQGLEEIKDGFEFKEIKQDLSSFRFEMSHEIDVLDEMCTSLVHTMKTFDRTLQDTFPIDELKSQLKNPETS